ncbi:MAG TPA: hypothetical protein VFL61_05195 [Gaiellaceae bacterium]|nr:hypothetical protein [Gaiellaceae bacterium]
MRDAQTPVDVTTRAIQIPRLPTPQLRLGALVAVGIAAFLAGWVIMNRGGDEAPAPAGAAAAKSESELRSVADSLSHPVYWAGPKEGHTYELTRTADGRVYVRYLPEGTEVGDPRGRFLTIGTYPRRSAFAELQRAARAQGAVSLKLGKGGLAVFSETRPTSVYFGYPGERYQVEVFHPSADEARRLALAGQVVPVE